MKPPESDVQLDQESEVLKACRQLQRLAQRLRAEESLASKETELAAADLGRAAARAAVEAMRPALLFTLHSESATLDAPPLPPPKNRHRARSKRKGSRNSTRGG